MTQCASKQHRVIQGVITDCTLSPTGVWDNKYCSISCKRGRCTLDFILCEAVKRIKCSINNGDINKGDLFYMCPNHGSSTAICVGCTTTKDDIGIHAVRKISLKEARENKYKLAEYKKLKNYLENNNNNDNGLGLDENLKHSVVYSKPHHSQSTTEEKISIDLTED